MKLCLTIFASIAFSFCFAQVERSTEGVKAAMLKGGAKQTVVVQSATENNSSIRLGPCGGHPKVNPLVVVDGEIVSMDFLKKVNPHDILSIQILKDQTALDKFGDKAQGGVIIIKMKCKEQTVPAA